MYTGYFNKIEECYIEFKDTRLFSINCSLHQYTRFRRPYKWYIPEDTYTLNPLQKRWFKNKWKKDH